MVWVELLFKEVLESRKSLLLDLLILECLLGWEVCLSMATVGTELGVMLGGTLGGELGGMVDEGARDAVSLVVKLLVSVSARLMLAVLPCTDTFS